MKPFLPDYRGGSLVNLMASIIRSRGGRSPHAELRVLPASRLRPARKLVYLVLDGLGERQLQRHLAAGQGTAFFASHPRTVISSVFPATTAAAVTTFATGASPAEHGIIGWHLNLPDLGLVSTILPALTRTRSELAPAAFNLGRYLALPRYLESVQGGRHLLSWGHIPTSRYSLAGPKWTRRAAFRTVRGLEREILRFARAPGRGLAYAYWPDYDSYCHEAGCNARQTRRHFDALDALMARLRRGVAGTGTTLLVTADHGLVDAPPGHRVELRDVPGFLDCLATLPSGDARQVHCFVRAGRERDFLDVVRRHLRGACLVLPGRRMLAEGWFGPGRPHPALAARCGDYVLLARGDHAFGTSLPGAKPEFNAANHGGASEAEMRVPLFVVSGDPVTRAEASRRS
jgi:hypothetical protein